MLESAQDVAGDFATAAGISSTLRFGFALVALILVLAAGRRNRTWALVAAPLLLLALFIPTWKLAEISGFVLDLAENAEASSVHAVRYAMGQLWFRWTQEAVFLLVFALAGLESCRRLALPGLPWLRWLLAREADPVRPGLARCVGEILVLAAGSLAWTALVWRIAGQDLVVDTPRAWRATWWVACLCLPAGEELTFRLGLQGVLQRMLATWRWHVPLAVGATALLWTLSHVGRGEHDLLRICQLAPWGVALGVLQRRHGTGACVLAHALSNVALLAWMSLPPV